MKITVLATGALAEPFWRDAQKEYEKRLSRTWPTAVCELPEARLSKNPSPGDIEAALKAEAVRYLEKIPKRAFVIALCVEGKPLSSEAFSQKLSDAATRGYSEIVFLIGSSHGLAPEVKARADLALSFSPMTFPHQLARILLLEQIYRAAEIARGSKYHK